MNNLPFNLSKRTKDRESGRHIKRTRHTGSHGSRNHSSHDHVIDDDDIFQTDSKRKLIKNVYKKPRKEEEFELPWDMKAKDDDDFKKDILQTTLMKPKRNRNVTHVKENNKLLRTLEISQREDELNEGSIQCPYCGETFNYVTDTLEEALKQMETKQDEQQKKEEDESSSFFKPADLVRKYQVSQEEQDAFCRLHRLELVIKPTGRRKGYPQDIQFDMLEQRIVAFKSELTDIINGRIKSDYREEALKAYDELGVIRARGVNAVMARFEHSLPGYYGPKGSSAILNVLVKLFIDNGYITREKAAPQLPLEYVQQVLIPEVGYRLIRQDLQLKYSIQSKHRRVLPNANEKAKEVMIESREYGNALYPVIDDIMDKEL